MRLAQLRYPWRKQCEAKAQLVQLGLRLKAQLVVLQQLQQCQALALRRTVSQQRARGQQHCWLRAS